MEQPPSVKVNELESFFQNKKVKKAFILGNTYEKSKSPLPKVINDVRDITNELKVLKFDCTPFEDIGDIKKCFEKYIDTAITIKDTHLEFIFYFSGHASVENGDLKLHGNNGINSSLKSIVGILEEKEKTIRGVISSRLEKQYKSEFQQIKESEIKEKKQIIEEGIKSFSNINDDDDETKREITKNNKLINLEIIEIQKTIDQSKVENEYKSMFLDIEIKKIFILDCCRTELESVTQFIKSKKIKDNNFDSKNTAFLYACSPGDITCMHPNGNSLLTKSILDRIKSDKTKRPNQQGRNLGEFAKVIQYDLVEQYRKLYFEPIPIQSTIVTTETTTNTSISITTTNVLAQSIDHIDINSTQEITVDAAQTEATTIHPAIEVSKEAIAKIEQSKTEFKGFVATFAQDRFKIILKKNLSLLRGDITVGDFVFYDFNYLYNIEEANPEVD